MGGIQESDINRSPIRKIVIIMGSARKEGFRDIRIGVREGFLEKKYFSIHLLDLRPEG